MLEEIRESLATAGDSEELSERVHRSAKDAYMAGSAAASKYKHIRNMRAEADKATAMLKKLINKRLDSIGGNFEMGDKVNTTIVADLMQLWYYAGMRESA